MDEASNYFTLEKNKSHEDDKIDRHCINAKAFVIRLGNFILEKIHKNENFDKTINDFILEVRLNNIKSSEEMRERDRKMIQELNRLQKESEDRKQKEISDSKAHIKRRNSDSFSSSNDGLGDESGYLNWSLERFKEHEAKIKEIFTEFDNNKGKIKIAEVAKLFTSITNELKMQVNYYFIADFSRMIENLYAMKLNANPSAKKKSTYYIINFHEFSEVLKAWGQKYNEHHHKVIGKLCKTIKEYERKAHQYKNYPELSDIITLLKSGLESLLSEFLNNNKGESVSMKKNLKKNIEDIFLFYGKAQKIQGKLDTFEGLESSNSTWNLGKFLKFCVDFKILQIKPSEERGLTKDQLVIIFKKTATNTRLMTENQLIEALDKISEAYYSVGFDKLYDTTYACLPLNEKRENLYKALGFYKSNDYHSIMKPFTVPHTPKGLIRMPQSELSHKADYKMPESLIKQIEHWKDKKTKISNSISPIVRSTLALTDRKNQNVRKSTNDLPIPDNGYSRRLKKSKLEARVAEDIIILPQEEDTKSKCFTNVLTIQALNNLDYQDIDDEINLNELISDEKDDYFDKIYGIDEKLQGIMKMHENKIAKGQKVLEKFNKS